MDLGKLAEQLIAKHESKTRHMSYSLRTTAQLHYRQGVGDMLRLIQEAAVEDEMRQKLAPLAVQPSHAATEKE